MSNNQQSEASLQGLEELTLDWSELDSAPRGSASGTSSASKSLPSTGQASPVTTTLPTLVQMPPVWTASRLGSHANPSATLVDERHRTTNDGFGPKWGESFAYFDPAQSCWKTSQGSLLLDSATLSVTWPRAGMTRSGIAYRLQPLAPRTCATAFSLSLHQATWPTPLTQDSKHAAATEWELGRPPQRDLLHVRVARRQMWPTPQASDDRDRGNLSTPAIQRRAAKGKQLNLSMVVSQGSGSLNPTWVEWLMGFPEGWTDLGP
jgi:hypothetical protein